MKKLKRRFPKKDLLCILLILTGFNSLSQSKPTIVYYECAINLKAPFNKSESLKIISNDSDTTLTTYSAPPSVDVRHILSKFKVVATANSSTIYKPFEVSESWRNPVTNSPDSIQYNGKFWYYFNKGKSTRNSSRKITFTETGEKKLLLGYNCRRIVGIYSETGIEVELWITEELPNTMMPTSELSPTVGGVLSCSFPLSGVSYLATNITAH